MYPSWWGLVRRNFTMIPQEGRINPLGCYVAAFPCRTSRLNVPLSAKWQESPSTAYVILWRTLSISDGAQRRPLHAVVRQPSVKAGSGRYKSHRFLISCAPERRIRSGLHMGRTTIAKTLRSTADLRRTDGEHAAAAALLERILEVQLKSIH